MKTELGKVSPYLRIWGCNSVPQFQLERLPGDGEGAAIS